jgi:hypothetical protein
MAHGGKVPDPKDCYSDGGYVNCGKIPGTPEVPYDSTKNDKVPIMASPGEVVLPASIAKSDKLHDVHMFLRNLEMNKGKK